MIATFPTSLPTPTTDRWQPLRLGIRNIWHYDNREFRFRRGRLILQGANGAGKTKVLELALPFLLDPDLTPRKLSPSESELRTMWWNLIEPRSDGSPTFQSKEGFVWLEFGRRDADGDRYFTVGARLRATSSTKAVKAHYFHTTLRVGSDLSLGVAAGDGDRERAISSVELRAAIGDTGDVTESRNEHRAAVDAALFGLGTRYEGLITLLRALRRPKLSEKLKLPELKSHLAEALPPVPDEVIERQAEVFDGLRQDEAELAEAKRAYDRVQRFLRVYEQYARRASAAAANELRAADAGVRESREEIRRAGDAAQTAANAVRVHDQSEADLQDVLDELDGRLEAVRRSPEMREATAIAEAERSAKKAESRAKDDATQARQAEGTSKRAVEQAEKLEARASDAVSDRVAAADAVRFDAVRLGLVKAAERIETAAADERRARKLIEETTRARRDELVNVRRRARTANDAKQTTSLAREALTTAEASVETARRTEGEAATARDEATATLLAAVRVWAASAVEVRIDDPTIEGLAALLLAGQRLAAAAGTLAQPTRDRLLLERTETGRRVAATTEEIRAKAARALEVRRTRLPRPVPDPVLPGPREDRAGAPFYELVDFAPGVSEPDRAGLEAALTAAGLLDAWVEPSGAVVPKDGVFDASVIGAGRVVGPSLAEVLRPVASPVGPERMHTVLASIGLGRSASASWVSTDGSFQMGQRTGRATKPAAAYVGAAARAAERRRAWRTLRAEVVVLRTRRATEQVELATLHDREAQVDTDLAALPSDAPLAAAVAAVATAAVRIVAATEQVTSAQGALDRAVDAETAAISAFEGAAKRASVDLEADLDDLIDAVTTFRVAAERLVDRVRDERSTAEAARDRRREASEFVKATQAAQATAAASRRQASELRGTADQLTASASDDARTVVAKEQTLASEREAKLAEQKKLRKAGDVTREAATAARLRSEAAQGAEQPSLDRRDNAAAAFARFAETGLLALAISLTVDDAEPISWAQRDALEISRRVDTTDAESFTPAAVNTAAAAVQNGVRGLQAELPASDFGSMITEDGHHVVTGRVGDDLLPIGRVAPLLADDIRQREEAFAEQHREAARRFLLEGAGDALSERIRAAQRLVEETSLELRRHETASGRHLRLRWTPSPEMPPETAHIISLLQKHPGDLRDEDRLVIAEFLRGQIDAASKLADEVGFATALEEQLDYRRWHVFRLDRFDGHRYVELTSRNFSASSEGERAVELHLPLFAAAAAFYNSARAAAPRLVMLDEVFSGIDDDMRASMFGITAAFDLDLVVTSPDEWGTYPTVDGCSIYILKREPDGGPRGVLARRFVWTGRERLDERGITAAGIA